MSITESLLLTLRTGVDFSVIVIELGIITSSFINFKLFFGILGICVLSFTFQIFLPLAMLFREMFYMFNFIPLPLKMAKLFYILSLESLSRPPLTMFF